VGGILNPLLVLRNTNTTAGGATFETYKDDQPTSTGGDPVGIWTASCNTNLGKTEITRISAVANGVGAGNNDGSLVLACKVNSSLAPVNFINCNGGAGTGTPPLGEVQVFKPLNMTGQTIITTSGDLAIDATPSSGTGDVNLTAKGDCSIISNGAGGAINLTSVSNVNIQATGDNLSLFAGNTMVIDAPILELKNIPITTTSPNHNANIQTTSNGVATNTFLKLKYGVQDIWIPYFTTDPSL
jgi:hypothetical protein